MKAVFKVTYNGKDISVDLTKHLLDISFTDNVTGVSDDLEINLEDKDGMWVNSWYPQKGAVLKLTIGYDNGGTITPNPFELDEIELNFTKSGGDLVSIKAIGAGIKKQLHTKNSHAHENKSLSDIVHTIAAKYGYTVIGNIENVVIGRMTQHREKDLTFLNRLADEYGYAFTIKSNKLIFIKLKTLEAMPHVATIDKTDCITANIKDKGISVFAQANVKAHNPNKNKVVKSSYSVFQQANNDGVQFNYLKEGGNSLEVHTKTENESQANIKAEAALHKHNSLQQTGAFTVPGNVILLAGNNIELTGFGVCSGYWNILKSVHTINKKDEYITSCEIKRIVPPTQSGSKKTAKVVKPKVNAYKVVSEKNKDGIASNFLVTQ